MTETSPIKSVIPTSFSCAHMAADVYAAQFTKIMHAKYERISPTEVKNKCSHLNTNNKSKLHSLLQSFSRLFSVKLGCYVHKKFTITLKDPNISPIFCRPYPIPMIHQDVFKKELQHLIDEQVQRRIPRSGWAFPTFLIPKNDGRVRWISDFSRLNKLLRRDRFFLPSIPTIMQKRTGFSFITKLDVSMGFYTFELDDIAQKYYAISTPFGLYQYLRLPMDLTNSPDIFQSVMHPLFQDIHAVECFIHDIGIFTTGSFDAHLTTLHQVLLSGWKRVVLQSTSSNVLRAFSRLSILDSFLQHLESDQFHKKIEAISGIERPMSTTHIRSSDHS